ncbi:MAG TPA: TolC family protein, partial [Longimicrobiales bacterium]|nr:TolC family protein [Longimicrobiales bacterium]
ASRTREGAREPLRLARERYRVGAGTFIELLEAETLLAQAENSYIVAVYDFHEALAALEGVVGRPLR